MTITHTARLEFDESRYTTGDTITATVSGTVTKVDDDVIAADVALTMKDGTKISFRSEPVPFDKVTVIPITKDTVDEFTIADPSGREWTIAGVTAKAVA